MPARDLERDEAHLPKKPRRREVFLDAPDMKNPYGVGAARHCPVQRNAVDKAAIVIMLSTDPDRRKYAWQRAGRQHRINQLSAAEPFFAGLLDAGRNALERDGKIFEPPRRQPIVQHSSQLAVAVQS